MLMSDLNSTERALIDYYRHSISDKNYQDIHVLGAGFVKDLEGKLSNYYNHKYCLCVCNATTALLGIWLSIGIKPGDLILTSPLSYPASIAGMMLLGAIPYFVDIESDTLGLNPEKVARILKHNRKIKAVLSIDYYGIPANSIKLKEITEQYKLPLISDSAQSLGSLRAKKPGGYFADIIVTSFGHHKTLYAGEGGAILTNSKNIYESIIWNISHPEFQKIKIGENNKYALNSRISPYSAIVANSNFENALSNLKHKQEKCFHLIEIMNKSNVIEPIDFKANDIIPSFYRLSGSWKQNEEFSILSETLKKNGYVENIYKDDMDLLYNGHQLIKLSENKIRHNLIQLPEAVKQVKKRFIISVS